MGQRGPVRRRAAIDPGGGRPSSDVELFRANAVVERSGALEVLGPLVRSGVGRPATLPLRALLVGCLLNASARHHRGHLAEVARVLNAMSDRQRASLGICGHDPGQTYNRLDRLFNKLCRVLEAGHVVGGRAVDAK